MAEPESDDKKAQAETDKKDDPKPDATPEPAKTSPVGGARGWILLFAVLVGAGVLVFASGRYLNDVGKVTETLVEGTKKTTRATIGGPFQLVDHNGKAVTEKSYPGKYLLMYFGYTYCPDVCPTGLTVISDALDEIGPLADRIVPVFVSIDPERDTPEQLREYVQYFHPRLVGMTGTQAQVAAIAKAYRVYYAKVPSEEPDADPDDYTMDHSALTYLMGPDGAFLQHFSHGTEPDAMAARLKEIIAP